MYLDTTLLCSVKPGFSEFVGENSLPADAFSKKIFRQE